MAVLTNARDADSITTSSLSGNGAATPTTDTEALGDHSAIQEWLRSSKTNSGSSLNNGPQASSHNRQDDAIETIGSLRVTRRSDPRAGDIFLIIDKSQNRVLACHNGYLHLEDVNTIDSEKLIHGHWQWLCTEKDGFKGFQNVAERGFLGHDIWWDFYAKIPYHKGWESFSLDRREGGYYWIQTLYWFAQWQVSARFDGSGVFAERDGGTLWEFVKVHQ